MKSIFSSDDKILAMQKTLTDLLNEKYNALDELITTLSRELDIDKNTIKELSEYMEKSKRDILDIKNNITDLQNGVSNIQDILSTATTDINNLKQTTQNNANNISNIQDTLSTATTDIANLKKKTNTNTTDIKNLTKIVEDNKKDDNQKLDELVKNDGEIIKQSKEYTDEKYDDLMKYIDEYHHIYPIGTLYHTTDKDGDVKDLNNFGEWRLVGQITLSDKDNIVEYIFMRIK